MGKMKYIGLTMMLVAGLLGIQGVASAQNGTSDAYESLRLKDMREILRFYEKGVERHSRVLFDEVASKTVSSDPEGWSVLSDIQGQVVGHSLRMESFIKDNPQSSLIPVMRLMYAFNVFDYQEYKTAGGQFALLAESDVKPNIASSFKASSLIFNVLMIAARKCSSLINIPFTSIHYFYYISFYAEFKHFSLK